MQENSAQLKRRIILILLFIIVLGCVFVASRYGFLSIQTTGSGGAEDYVYTIKDQESGKITEVKSNSPSIKRLMKRSSYEVTVKHSDKNALAVINTRGFLQTANAQTELLKEKNRAFVGDNPEFCMYYAKKILYSYACRGANTKSKHLPATNTTPTYILKNSKGVPGSFESTTQTSNGTLALFKFNGLADIGPHTVFLWDEDMPPSSGAVLSDLNPSESYSLQSSGNNGFFVYNSGYSDIFYYPAQRQKPKKFAIDTPNDPDMQPISFSARGEDFLVAFSNNSGDDDEPDDYRNNENMSEFIFNLGGVVKTFTLDKSFYDAELCGINKLCLLGDKRMWVYEIGEKGLVYEFSVYDVQAVEQSDKNMLIINTVGVLNLNVDTQTGAYEYMFGDDYRFCGIQIDNKGYLLCLINSNNRKVVVRINQTSDNTDSIDKKVAELGKLPEVKSISVYGGYIYISPESGELRYNAGLGGFGYDPATLKNAELKINQKVSEVGIDKSKYSVKVVGVD